MSKIIGIDLGTTNSLTAVFGQEGPELIPNAVGTFMTSSVVGLTDSDRVLWGAAAREMSISRPERCGSQFKRLMGTDQTMTLGDKTFTAPELSSLILRSLKQDAEAHLGVTVNQAVITVPAYFNDNQRIATKLAGELAGLEVCRIINEPTAAALTYGFHEPDADKKIMVFDLGGGTFDVTLMEIFEGALEIIATAGESMLGGEDFTEAVLHHVCTQMDVHFNDESASRLQRARLRRECDLAKVRLSHQDEAEIRIPNLEGRFEEDARVFSLTRPLLEQICEPLKDRLKGPIVKVLRDAGIEPGAVEEVILVGGATRMPMVRDFLTKFFGKEPLCRFNPDEVVALGAAVQAALMQEHEAVEDLVMTDVCPFTLGIETSKYIGRDLRSGYYLPIIHRNTTVPVSREELVYTIHPNQREILVKVYQGESRRTRDNLLLGELRVTDIPRSVEEQAVFVRFTYDMNGILEVEAVVSETGEKFKTVLTHHVKGLNPAEIEDAVARMQEVKFYPRDEIRNQRLLFFCERIIGELNALEREKLEPFIDQYENALHENDPELFESCRDALIECLEQLGWDYEEDAG